MQEGKTRGIHVLVVEDNPDDVFFLKRSLDRLGIQCQISFAVNGAEAIDFLSSSLHSRESRGESAVPTHVLLDLKMPLKSGIEVLDWLRKHPVLKELPVVVYTNSSERSDVDQALRLGIHAYRVKPVGFEDHLRIVEEIARSWKLL